MLRKVSGFTLIEIMVVIGVILIILALALPNMLRSRLNANEIAAIANCRLISNACQSFYTNVMPHAYPRRLSDLIAPTSVPPYIDSLLASGLKQGYRLIFAYVNSEAFTLNANPRTVGKTGIRYFFVDETGVIRANSTGPAGASDPPVGG